MTRVLFFDGYCSLCNGLVDWVVRHQSRLAPELKIRMASLQGETAQRYFPARAAGAVDFDTVVYHRDGVALERSTAILFLVSDLGGPWQMAKVGFLIPLFVRDTIYGWVAKNRYRLFGRRDSCRLPTPEEKDLFLP